MKIRYLSIPFLACVLFISCRMQQKKKQGDSGTMPPKETLTIDFFPSWGGSSEALLERKNGKDNLYSTYHEKVNGNDTIISRITFVNASSADSIYSLAEKVIWNADANHGTAEGRVGLKFNMELKKGRTTKSVGWENLQNANELPADIISVIQIVNRLAPEDFKLY